MIKAMWSDLSLIISCWFLLFFWQLMAVPFNFLFFRKWLFDGGWAVGRVTSWLMIATPIWLVGHLGLPVNQPVVIYGLFFLWAIIAIRIFLVQRREIVDFFQNKWSVIITGELVGLAAFIFLGLVRGYNPEINGLEKFMDGGLIAAYLRSPTLPIEDMWLAGQPVNYYTFGHYLGAVASSFWGLRVDLSYNLLLAWIMCLVAQGSYGTVVNWVAASWISKTRIPKKTKWPTTSVLIKAGLLAAFLITLGGNGHLGWYWLKNKTTVGYWYPDATRFIDRTIHEFPAYSFIVSDLHAHVWGMPLVLWWLAQLMAWVAELSTQTKKLVISRQIFSQPWLRRALGLGLTFGLIMSTSTWDLMIYGLLLIILGIILLLADWTTYFRPLVASAVAVGIGTLLAAAPWLLNFESISEGMRIATEHSPFWQLLVLWLPHFSLSLVAMFIAVKISQRLTIKLAWPYLLVIAAVLTSAMLLVLPELIFFKDIYPNHPRANTMFKLTFQAFIQMGLVISWLSGLVSQTGWATVKKQLLLRIWLVIFVAVVGSYSYFGYRDFYFGLKEYRQLDGLVWLQTESWGDYQVISWLRQKAIGRPVVLEAVGESYTTFARISTFSGLPTVLGWRVHEWLWRGGFDIPGQRTEEVKTIYEQPLSAAATDLLNQYQVKYIVIGDKEREAYPNLNLAGLLSLGELVGSFKNSTYLIELAD